MSNDHSVLIVDDDEGLTHIIALILRQEDFGVRISLENLGIDHFRSVTSIAEFVASGGRVSAWGTP